ncbi:P-loop containing nucleoside triphosphate hydrolase protein [Tricladium varicosporioides]|nr:P-loop containing nucleoside triphosphate hydrolase protein [Hymenoscyphus varicosporioides]
MLNQSLDLVEFYLKNRNISFVRIDGTHKLSQRQNILSEYHGNPTKFILLMAIGTEAIGCPQWNPIVDSQAIGRVFRMGQTRKVKVLRYITKDTVEEVSFEIQFPSASSYLLRHNRV